MKGRRERKQEGKTAVSTRDLLTDAFNALGDGRALSFPY